MNKKIIAIAIAAAMAAPVAMADVNVGGQIGAALVMGSKGYVSPTADGGTSLGTDADKSFRTMQDNGLSKLEFSGASGDAFFKIGADIRQFMGGGATKGRDFWLGYKFGTSSVTAGRMPAALAGLEGDKYNATFLEMRRTAAVSTGAENTNADSYTASPVLQFATKAGGATIKVQYDPADNVDNAKSSKAEGYYAVSVKGQAGAVGYFAGVNNGSGTEGTPANDESTMKVGASMKFGAVKATVMMSSDTNAAATKKEGSAVVVFADMGLGNGLSAGLGYGMTNKGDADKDTWMRLAVSKDLSKGTSLFGGYVAKHDESAATNKDTNALGVGMKIKF